MKVDVDHAFLSCPLGFLNSSWIQVDAGRIIGADIAAWSHGVSISIKFASFHVLYNGFLVLTTLVIFVFPFWTF